LDLLFYQGDQMQISDQKITRKIKFEMLSKNEQKVKCSVAVVVEGSPGGTQGSLGDLMYEVEAAVQKALDEATNKHSPLFATQPVPVADVEIVEEEAPRPTKPKPALPSSRPALEEGGVSA
jgi:hypothetical protein